MIGIAHSRYSISNIELPQNTARTLLQNVQVYLAQVATAISPSLALSGTQTFEANSSQNLVSLSLVEIKEGVSSTTPTVTTTAASDVKRVTASSGGNVTSDGGAAITARGVCWNLTGTPTTSDSKTTDSGTTGSYTSSVTGLTAGKLYYLRAYATNSAGTSYGSQVTFTTARIVFVI